MAPEMNIYVKQK